MNAALTAAYFAGMLTILFGQHLLNRFDNRSSAKLARAVERERDLLRMQTVLRIPSAAPFVSAGPPSAAEDAPRQRIELGRIGGYQASAVSRLPTLPERHAALQANDQRPASGKHRQDRGVLSTTGAPRPYAAAGGS